jgi:hypothetical protein
MVEHSMKPRQALEMPYVVPTTATMSSTMSTQESQTSKQEVPQMTVGTSDAYNDKMSMVLSHAMLPSPNWQTFVTEGEDGIGLAASEKDLLQAYQSIIEQYLSHAARSGAFIAEAGGFSACASWWPPGSHDPPKDPVVVEGTEPQGETLRASSHREIEKVRFEHVWSRYGQGYWYLGLLGRDPRKPAVPGAVRAVLKPFVDQAAADGKPIWLTTTSRHAREIYLHFGWEVVSVVNCHGHSQWCMMLYPPAQDIVC